VPEKEPLFAKPPEALARAEEDLRFRLKFEKVLLRIIADFVDVPAAEVDGKINHALESMGRFAGVDRAYVFLLRDGGRLASNTHEWCAPGVEPQRPELQDLELDTSLPWFAERIRRGVFQVPRVADLPDEARAEREHFAVQGIQSLVVVPMVREEALLGFLGFDSVREEKSWSGDSITLLQIAGGVITTGLARREAELALLESEERYRGLVEHTSDLVWEVDAGGVYTYVSPKVREMLGYEPEELIGRTPFELMPPEEAQRVREIFEKQAREARPFAALLKRNLRPDGRPVVLETSGVPLFDPQGRFRGYRGIDRDVTERERAEEALRQSEERLRALVQNLSDMIHVLDGSGVIRYESPSCYRVLGYEPGAMLEQKAFDLVHPEDLELLKGAFGEVIRRTNPGIPTEFRFRRADGRYVFLEAVATNLLDNPVIQGIVVTSRDIGERKRAEEERRELETQMRQTQHLESLGILAGGIAHDFNNLLTGILGNASLALADLPARSAALESVALIENAALKAAELTKQMLAYSGRGQFVVQAVDLSQVVEEMAQLLGSSISKKSALEYRFAPKLPPIEADVAQLRQVVMNLILNASEAIGDSPGVIDLSTGVEEVGPGERFENHLGGDPAPGRYVFLTVADTGSGMTPEVRARIFEPFFTTKFTGRGLGLAAVLGIVRGHRGAIRVESEVGRGTTIQVLFPASGRELEATRVAGPRRAVWQGRGTVLLVDDEPVVRTFARRVLERAGLEVLSARDGEEGIEVFRARAAEIDVVLLDLTMPRKGGEEVLRELRAVRADVKVILASGYTEHEVSQRFAEVLLSGVIQKPFSVEKLLEAVRRALSS
jgi:PAS domain S-box-containing protein